MRRLLSSASRAARPRRPPSAARVASGAVQGFLFATGASMLTLEVLGRVSPDTRDRLLALVGRTATPPAAAEAAPPAAAEKQKPPPNEPDEAAPPAAAEKQKQLLNDPREAVRESLEGLLQTAPFLSRLDHPDPDTHVVLRNDRAGGVAVISGGGAGHEPAHAGLVGPGMLTAAVSGGVFASPSSDAVLAAIRAAASPAGEGVLLVIKCYTGDRFSFGLAASQARLEGIPVEVVVVEDDAALPGRDGTVAGRRGLAGTVLVHKVAGAAAEAGLPLAEVAAEARAAAASLSSVGVALSACTLPGRAYPPGLPRGGGEYELGLGIHGEPGLRRLPLGAADTVVDEALDTMLGSGYDGAPRPGDRVALLVNNLGSATGIEMGVVARRAAESLRERGLRVERVYAGPFCTSLDMRGVSLSVLRLDGGGRRLALLDADARAPGWGPAAAAAGGRTAPLLVPAEAEAEEGGVAPAALPQTPEGKRLAAAVRAAAEALRGARDRLNDLDSRVGDGDCGDTMRRGAERVLADLPSYPADEGGAAVALAVAASFGRAAGGSSGVLYRVGLLELASRLSAEPGDVGAALEGAVDAVSQVGGAREGMRTMLDALGPAARAYRAEASVAAAARAARRGADATAHLEAKAGRSSYLADDTTRGVPDPGAVAAAVWIGAVAEEMAKK